MKAAVDEFDQEVLHAGGRCFWSRLTEEQRVKVEDAKDRGHNFATIARVLSNHWGISVRPQPVSKHFRGECSCGR